MKGEAAFKISKKKIHKTFPDHSSEMKKKHCSRKGCNEEPKNIKVSFPLNALIVERLAILLQNALIRTQAMKMLDQPKQAKDKPEDQTKETFSKGKTTSTQKKKTSPPPTKTGKTVTMKNSSS